ncbi:hypothetical protein HK105_209293 [Polyrhizophydium stewartii]|uniref:Uncharacterized protein n=1 Tax=Polyrhizophydium stewartii TaxID=2732419 RepID=A0ABR4MVE2_9FUNG
MPNYRPKKKAKQPVASGAAGMMTTTTSNTGSVSMHVSDSTNIAPMQVDSTTEGNAAAAVAAMSTSTALKKKVTRRQAVKNKLGKYAPPELSKPSSFGAYKQYVSDVVTKICDQGLAASPKPPPAGAVEQRAQDLEYCKSLAAQGRRTDYIRACLEGAAEALQRTVHIASLAVNAYIADAFKQVNLSNIGKHLEPTKQTKQTDPFVLGSNEIASLLRLCPRSPSLQVLKGESFVHKFYEKHLKHRLDPLRAELADHQGLSRMLEYVAITMATNLRVMTSTTFSNRIRAWARARLNALVSHYLGHLAIVKIYTTPKVRDASVEQVVSHAMGWIGPRFLDKKAPFREIGDATGATFSAYMHTRFQIKDARFKDSVAPIDWKSVWADLNSKVLDYFKTYLNDDWVASRRLMILRAVLRDVEVLEDEIQNKFRSENPGTRQQPPQLKNSSRRNEVKLKFDDFFSPNLFVKHGEMLTATRRFVINRFLVSDGISTSIISEYVPRDPESSQPPPPSPSSSSSSVAPPSSLSLSSSLSSSSSAPLAAPLPPPSSSAAAPAASRPSTRRNGPTRAAILERHDDPDNIFNAPDLQQLLDRNIRFLCTIDFNRKNYLVLRIAPLDKSYEYTGDEPTSKRGRKLVHDGVIFLKISKKEYKRVRCISRYNRIREQLEDQERCQRKRHGQMDIFANPPSIKGTSVQLVWHRIAFLAETDTTQADTTQPNTTQPNARKPNAQETKATSSESAGKGCRFGMLMQFYARHVFRRLRMESFSAKQKWPIHVQDRIYDAIQRLRPDWKVRNPRKCRDQDNPRILFAVGDGNFKHNSAGHITMPTATPLFESFRALGEAGYWVDEYNTSKCCSRGGLEMEQGLKHKNAQPLASAAAAQKERKASKIIKRRAKELTKYARNRIRQNEKRIEQLLQTRPILPQRPISREVAECAIRFALVDVARQHKEGSKDEYGAALDFARRLQASLDAALQSAAQDATAPPERLVRKRQSPRVGADRRLSCFPPQSLQHGTDPLVASNYNAKDLISPWGLRYCPGCKTLWCRDKNAVINMALRVLFYLNQPQQFDKEGKPMPKQDGPPHLALGGRDGQDVEKPGKSNGTAGDENKNAYDDDGIDDNDDDVSDNDNDDDDKGNEDGDDEDDDEENEDGEYDEDDDDEDEDVDEDNNDDDDFHLHSSSAGKKRGPSRASQRIRRDNPAKMQELLFDPEDIAATAAAAAAAATAAAAAPDDDEAFDPVGREDTGFDFAADSGPSLATIYEIIVAVPLVELEAQASDSLRGRLRAHYASMTPEQRDQRVQLWRAIYEAMSAEHREQMMQVWAHGNPRANETQEQMSARRKYIIEYHRRRRANMTPEQREANRKRRRELYKIRPPKMTPEDRAKRTQKQRERRAQETPEERERRRQKQREYDQRKLDKRLREQREGISSQATLVLVGGNAAVGSLLDQGTPVHWRKRVRTTNDLMQFKAEQHALDNPAAEPKVGLLDDPSDPGKRNQLRETAEKLARDAALMLLLQSEDSFLSIE